MIHPTPHSAAVRIVSREIRNSGNTYFDIKIILGCFILLKKILDCFCATSGGLLLAPVGVLWGWGELSIDLRIHDPLSHVIVMISLSYVP